MNTHDQFMQRCYELAAIAASEGESPVGSVLVSNGLIIGEGTEKSRQLKDVTRHAEVVAILDALQKGKPTAGSILYSNVEPCILCSYAIRHYKIAEVVFEKHTGELGGTHAPFNLLTAADFTSWDQPPVITVYTRK
ncbi:nucleoside deaminase [Chitinophaga agri]|uniref:Nucleoside deaminase n=1 Tax=Chitinophaga agri TaxID=2703787 RepID=A0A6B9ZQH3_9BACT|nr:nucleoside deaminase [Chitinophaga agri]QHS63994.1 nucleoside deaminase [Chitinophaga agri]